MNQQFTNERYIRQQDIVPAERLRSITATVIGVGAIGRQVALQLAAMGVVRLKLVDFDVVEPVNLASQGFLEKNVGKLKVQATCDLCRQINSSVEIQPLADRFRRGMDVGNAVFCAVDRIDTRRLIWDSVKNQVSFFCDGRMTAESLRILIACDLQSRRYYPTTLFSAAEAYTGPCTARTTIYCSNIAAGLMLTQFAKYLRQLPIEADIQLNLLASELAVAGEG